MIAYSKNRGDERIIGSFMKGGGYIRREGSNSNVNVFNGNVWMLLVKYVK